MDEFYNLIGYVVRVFRGCLIHCACAILTMLLFGWLFSSC